MSPIVVGFIGFWVLVIITTVIMGKKPRNKVKELNKIFYKKNYKH